MRKEDFRQRRDISGNIQDHWAMESGKDLLSNQYIGFQLGQSSKALDLKDDSVAWKDKREGESKETSKVSFQNSGLGTRRAIEKPVTQKLKGKLFRQEKLKIWNIKLKT